MSDKKALPIEQNTTETIGGTYLVPSGDVVIGECVIVEGDVLGRRCVVRVATDRFARSVLCCCFHV